MKRLALLFLLLGIISCSEEQHELTVKGNIKGLKKGTVYLKKNQDTLLVTLDSLNLMGSSRFELHSQLDSPEMLYLVLDKNATEDNSISFFADKGITEINTTLKHFVFDAKIKGSNQQKVLEEYKLMSSRFSNKNLDLIEDNFKAQKDGDNAKLEANQKAYENLLKRRYLYTVNFAIMNKDSEVAPYLALSEIFDANINLLDTINNSLTDKVKMSTYGKRLEEFISKRKAEEAKNN